jgi:hypothetical protein
MKASFGAVDWDGKYNGKGGRELSWNGAGGDPQTPDNYVALTKNGVSGAKQPVASPIASDGESREGLWAGKPSYAFSQGGVITVTAAFDPAGLCLFFNATDRDVWAASGKIYENDGVEIYLDTQSDGGEKPQRDDYQIRVDAAGRIECLRGDGNAWVPAGNPVQAGVRVLGEINGGAADAGFNIEVFLPWSDLGLSGAPAQVKASFGAPRAAGGVFEGWSGIGKDPQIPNTYIVITPDRIAP